MNALVPATIEKMDRAPVVAGGKPAALVPTNFEAAWRFAEMIARSGMAPYGMESAEKLMVAIIQGLEVGLTPMAAVQSIAVVNGRPSIFGDGAIALVHASGLCEFVEEEIVGEGDAMKAICRCKRKGAKKAVEGTFSVDDAKRAGLWQTEARVMKWDKFAKAKVEKDNDSPWYRYPKRMLQMRARGFALRDGFADVLKGMILREEAEDIVRVAEPAPLAVASSKPPAPPEPAAAAPVIGHQSPAASAAPPTSDQAPAPDAEAEHADQPAILAELEERLALLNTEDEIAQAYEFGDYDAALSTTETGVGLARKIRDLHLERIARAAERKPATPPNPDAISFDEYKGNWEKTLAHNDTAIKVKSAWQQARGFRESQGFTATQVETLKQMTEERLADFEADEARD